MRNRWLAGVIAVASLSRAPPLAAAAAPALATAEVRTTGAGDAAGFDGVVEAVRQTVVAAQVAGAVVALDVKAGDAVKAGPGARTHRRARGGADRRRQRRAGAGGARDARGRDQGVRAAEAAVREEATPARPRSSAPRRSSRRRRRRSRRRSRRPAPPARSPASSWSARRTAAWSPRCPVALGDMAMPGRALLTLYDPAALRVSVAVPQTAIARDRRGAEPIKVELPGLAGDRADRRPTRVERAADGRPGHAHAAGAARPARERGGRDAGHLRAGLAAGCRRGGATRSTCPAQAVVRRAEMTGLYVLDPQGTADAAPGAARAAPSTARWKS